MTAVPEFSRLVPLASLGRDPFVQAIEADAEERAALARRFGLISLDRLAAQVTLRRLPRDGVLLEARFEAEFAQECVVTLEPVAGSVADGFSLRYGPPDSEAEDDPASEQPAFEPLPDAAVDIGEAVAQEFSLALPLSPRLPEADAALAEVTPAEPADNPFAVLRRLAEE